MIARDLAVEKILARLNQQVSEGELVHWAQEGLLALSESGVTVADEAEPMDVLAYIGAGDSPGFPLSWSGLSHLLEQLRVKVRVVAWAIDR